MLKKKFTEEEDSKIIQLVKQNGARNWNIIAESIPGRTGRQCRDRYQNYLCPGFFNGQWTKEEDELLHEKYNLMGCQWSKMMKFFPKRSANSLRNRMNYFLRKYNNEKKDNYESVNTLNYEISNNQNIQQYYIPNFNILGKNYFEFENQYRYNGEFVSNINYMQDEITQTIHYVNENTQTEESSFKNDNYYKNN